MTDVGTKFEPRELRSAFGLFPTGVVVVTAFGEDRVRLGMTVSSFNTVSLDPPLILFSILNTAKALPQWLAASAFCVNVLGEEQSALSTRFARAETDKWKDVPWRPGEAADVPMLEDCVAQFECRLWQHYAGGDHTIMVGQVLAFRYRRTEHLRPLVFCGGRYRNLDSDVDATAIQSHEWMLGW